MQFLDQAPVISEKAVKVMENVGSGDTGALHSAIEQLVRYSIDAGKSILIAVIIYMVGKFLMKLIEKIMDGMMQRRKVDPTIQSFLRSFVHILLTILLLITVVSALGINTTSFAALLASAGVAVGMALSGNLQNLAGGILILLFKPFHVGDFIEAHGIAGVVKEIQIFHTIITTPDNKQVFIPNGSLSSGNIVNYSSNELRRVDFTIGVEYDTDATRVREVLMEIFEKDERILKEDGHKPVVLLSELADSSVNFFARVWVKGADYWNVYFETQERVYAEFNKQKINFPFPQLTVHQG